MTNKIKDGGWKVDLIIIRNIIISFDIRHFYIIQSNNEKIVVLCKTLV